VSDRTANQNLVPEPKNEAQEGDPGHQGAERAGEASPGLKDRRPFRSSRPRRRRPLTNTQTNKTHSIEKRHAF